LPHTVGSEGTDVDAEDATLVVVLAVVPDDA
jgi:hypothetical protein